MQSELRVKVNADGSLKIDASRVYGTEDGLLGMLRTLAETVGGDASALTVEAHRHDHVGAHHHHHNHEGQV